MTAVSNRPGALVLFALLSLPASGNALAQQLDPADPNIIVKAPVMTPGPDIKGVISARNDEMLKITAEDGTSTIVAVNDATRIKAGGGLFGGKSGKHTADALLTGLPVTVRTMQSDAGLVASQISFKGKDLKIATMIRNGTAQRFAEQGEAIDRNTAIAAALRGRMGDIDKYNVKGTTNVYFDTGKWNLSPRAQYELCDAATRAEAMDNALLLVVGYTDSVGSQDFNQVLSEKRAGRVVNYLQQACHWKPYRMLTPTGMAMADPLASNDTPEGKAQNRRVSVNILVSKGLDGL